MYGRKEQPRLFGTNRKICSSGLLSNTTQVMPMALRVNISACTSNSWKIHINISIYYHLYTMMIRLLRNNFWKPECHNMSFDSLHLSGDIQLILSLQNVFGQWRKKECHIWCSCSHWQGNNFIIPANIKDFSYQSWNYGEWIIIFLF